MFPIPGLSTWALGAGAAAGVVAMYTLGSFVDLHGYGREARAVCESRHAAAELATMEAMVEARRLGALAERDRAIARLARDDERVRRLQALLEVIHESGAECSVPADLVERLRGLGGNHARDSPAVSGSGSGSGGAGGAGSED